MMLTSGKYREFIGETFSCVDHIMNKDSRSHHFNNNGDTLMKKEFVCTGNTCRRM